MRRLLQRLRALVPFRLKRRFLQRPAPEPAAPEPRNDGLTDDVGHHDRSLADVVRDHVRRTGRDAGTCPFCGDDREPIVEREVLAKGESGRWWDRSVWWAECRRCAARGPASDDGEAARAGWRGVVAP